MQALRTSPTRLSQEFQVAHSHSPEQITHVVDLLAARHGD